MKKNIIMGMAVLMLAGCAKVESVLAPEGQMVKSAAGEKIEITVTLPEVEALQTRVTLKENAGGGFDTGWETGDKILVGGNEFTLVSADGMTGKFSGNMPEGNTFDIVYPAAAQQAAAVQKADKDYSHIKYSVSLLGVNSLEDVHFSHAWAGAHGGKFAQSGCLKAVLNLPANTAAVTGVEVSGEGIETLSLSVENGALSGSSFTAYIPCGRIELDSEKKVTIVVTTAKDEALSNSFFPGTQTLYEGYLVSLVTSASKWQKTLNGKGSESDPYMVNNYEEFNNIRNIISPNTYTYFKLAADIDMSAVKDWQPINNLNEPYGLMFDGCGHKITGFSCTYGERASVFGVLHGEVKNLILEDASVVTTTSSPCGVVAAWVGNIDATLQGRLENVKVVRGKVSNSSTAVIGGMTGRSGAGTFVNCSFDGVVERTAANAYSSSYNPAGGILGEALMEVSFKGCSTSGSLTTASGRACGGIFGLCSNPIDVSDCSSTMELSARDDVAGGIAGYYGTGTISNCHVKTNITVREKGSGSSYVGGIAGHTSGQVLITGCSFEGNLTAYMHIVGGILGQCNTSTGNGCTIEKCISKGTISAQNTCGGIIGRATDYGLVLTDCGSLMDVNSISSYVGGVVGDLPKNSTVRNCFTTGKVAGSFSIGGFAGRAFGRQGSSASLDADVNTTIENCIAFNPSVVTTVAGGEDPTGHYSGGAFVGCTSRPNTLKNCWRKNDMVFEYYKDATLNVLFDHPDSSPQAPLTQTVSTAKWFSPYHGKAASADATVSSVAQSLGWSAEIWDFSADVPVLKK